MPSYLSERKGLAVQHGPHHDLIKAAPARVIGQSPPADKTVGNRARPQDQMDILALDDPPGAKRFQQLIPGDLQQIRAAAGLIDDALDIGLISPRDA